jgi:glycosyltransferase involved in cell wall biosynthesis
VSETSYRANIPPITDGKPRPRWSVVIPTFNSAPYLEETLASVLGQDPGEADMEIIVVDDHSTEGDPAEIVQRVGRGRVRFVRQDNNVGKVRNFETALKTARGHLVHQLHGDDRVRNGFYEAMGNAFDRFPDVGAFFCESFYVDENGAVVGRTGREREETGPLNNWLDRIVTEQRIQTPSIVLRRQVYESLGGFDRRLDMVEDWEMWIRVASAFQMGFVAEAQADYRVSPGGTTSRAIASGRIFRHLKDMIAVVDEYLPAQTVERCKGARNKALAQYLTQFIPSLMQRHERGGVVKVWFHALTYSIRPRAIYRLFDATFRYKRSLKRSPHPIDAGVGLG